MLKRQEEFKKLKLGLFLHYGLYTHFQKGEWYWNMYHLNEQKYYSQCEKIKLKDNFKEICKWAKDNHFKYIILTAKHHDGYALYDSQGLSKYDIKCNNNSDLVNSFIIECENNRIKPILYYATMDWVDQVDFDLHVTNILQNIELLLKQYGERIGGFWFDGDWSEPNKDWKVDTLYQTIRHYHPEAIIINNTGLENRGKLLNSNIDSVTFEQGLNKKIIEVLPFETVIPINDHWGIAKYDFNYKSVSSLIKTFVETIQLGGNLLLNIGIDENGNLEPFEKMIVEKFSQWTELTDNWWEEDLDNYLVLKNVKSGAHVDNIQFGNQSQDLVTIPVKNAQTIKRMSYVDTKENIDITILSDKNAVSFYPNSFEYGYNTIYRIIKIERKE